MLAIIPARGGSKGLPGKNIKLLNGKPLIAYTIEAAKMVPEITTIFVSTDDPEIAKISIEFGAECPMLRPPFLSDDGARSIDVYNYVLKELEKEKGEIEEFIVLQPTSPLRTSQQIHEAISLFKNKNADSVISYCKEDHPIVWHKYVDEEGRFVDIFKNRLTNRQEERESFYPNGAIYVFKADLIRRQLYYSEHSYMYLMPRTCSVDIDSIDDFEYAEYLMTKIHNSN